MSYFADILLPIPLERQFTYAIPLDMMDQLQIGIRVAVPFGKSKLYTGLVVRVHQEPPTAYQPKEIDRLLDVEPLITSNQLQHWNWIATYYMCTLGEVFRTALPSVFLLESETRVLAVTGLNYTELDLDDDEYLILEALEQQPVLSVDDILEITDRKQVLSLLQRMLAKGVLRLQEKLQERYVPKQSRYIRLHTDYLEDNALEELLETLNRAPKQSQLVLSLFQLQEGKNKPVKSKALEREASTGRSIIKTLIDKGVLEEYFITEDRLGFDGNLGAKGLPDLNETQQMALSQIVSGFEREKTVLLHGVTASGKTEVYIRLIHEALKNEGQILYLVPEIALTEQLIRRLQAVFGSQVSVFHSRQNLQERAELWHHVRLGADQAKVILGARSALFLPFSRLKLILIDEEHENTYKQFDPAPRYHARDAAIVLASYFNARVLLGSATPSVESYHNAVTGKYHLVEMSRRYGNVLLPEIELVDLSDCHKRKRMHGHFSERLRVAISEAIGEGNQVILFQNRRGYAPIVECTSCGHAPHCVNCDVSLTYHQYRKELRCHYCGYHRQLDPTCDACGNATLDPKGFGTEQVEQELKQLFPKISVARMDLDTTRGKHGYQRIIEAFEGRETDVLVGTQMLTKGLDFRHVSLVGIMNADSLLNFPHFRAHERCFQLLTQVAGRAGRTRERGKVLIQTYNPYHQILRQVSDGDFLSMYRDQVYEREQFLYPPRVRLIKITFAHREFNRVAEGSDWFAKSLRLVYAHHVLGPEFPPVARIRNQYQKNILLKIPSGKGLATIKNSIKRIENSFNAISQYRSIRVYYNVDYI